MDWNMRQIKTKILELDHVSWKQRCKKHELKNTYALIVRKEVKKEEKKVKAMKNIASF